MEKRHEKLDSSRHYPDIHCGYLFFFGRWRVIWISYFEWHGAEDKEAFLRAALKVRLLALTVHLRALDVR